MLLLHNNDLKLVNDNQMSCHYSCATCSAAVFMYKCLTCPSTRQLADSTCVCKSGYYQNQQTQCYPSQQATWAIKSILSIADALYYTNIGLFWLYVIIIFCRVNSPKLRILINFGQIIALINQYPFLFDQISKQFIWSLSSLNFMYYFNFFTCSAGSTLCKLLQYIWQPLLVLPSLIICLILSYFLVNICYKFSLSQTVNFCDYFKSNMFFVVFAFIDFTSVILSYNITKALLLTYWGYIFAGVYLFVVIFVIIKYFRLINTQQQSKIVYRSQFNWAFGYDQSYHLHFIDFLYSQARLKRSKTDENELQTFNTSMSFAVFPQKQEQEKQKQKQKQKINMFVPHSNLYMIQIVTKILFGSTTALLYQQKPTFIVFSLILIMNIGLCWLGAFFYYDKLNLLLYLCMSLIVLVCSSCYWLQFYWFISFAAACLVSGLAGAVFIVLFFVNRKINDKLVNKIFNHQQNSKQKIQSASQQQILSKNKVLQAGRNQQIQPIKEQQNQKNTDLQIKKQKRQPFSGNLAKNVKPKALKNSQNIQNILNEKIQEQDLLKTQNKKNDKKSKTIFKDLIKEQNDQKIQQNNLIRPSRYQAKITDVRSKISAKNRTRNALQDSQPQKEQTSSKFREKGSQSQQNLNQRNSQNTFNKTKKNNDSANSIKKAESQLQDILKQPSDPQKAQSLNTKNQLHK